MSRAASGSLALSGGVAVGAVLLVAGVVAVLGYDAPTALRALAVGSFGSGAAWAATLSKSSPLLLTGLAVALCFRCGVWNIGAEGQFVAGALAATVVATRLGSGAPGPLLLPAVVLGAALAGAALGAVAGALRARRGVNEVISTLMLNFVALQLLAFAVQGPLQELAGSYPKSDPFPAAARLPAAGRVHAGVAAAGLLALAVHGLVFRTALGFRLRAVGLSPRAARFAGISPERYGWIGLALGGGLAGLAGGFEVSGVTGQLYEGISPGYGFTAIAVALLARLHPLGVVPAALFFGALETGAAAMQREAGVPSVVTQVVQGAVVLFSAAVAGLATPGWGGGSAARPDPGSQAASGAGAASGDA